jgi:hypothetical protein
LESYPHPIKSALMTLDVHPLKFVIEPCQGAHWALGRTIIVYRWEGVCRSEQ